jgi:hypothetical protein
MVHIARVRTAKSCERASLGVCLCVLAIVCTAIPGAVAHAAASLGGYSQANARPQVPCMRPLDLACGAKWGRDSDQRSGRWRWYFCVVAVRFAVRNTVGSDGLRTVSRCQRPRATPRRVEVARPRPTPTALCGHSSYLGLLSPSLLSLLVQIVLLFVLLFVALRVALRVAL